MKSFRNLKIAIESNRSKLLDFSLVVIHFVIFVIFFDSILPYLGQASIRRYNRHSSTALKLQQPKRRTLKVSLPLRCLCCDDPDPLLNCCSHPTRMYQTYFHRRLRRTNAIANSHVFDVFHRCSLDYYIYNFSLFRFPCFLS